MNRFVSLVLSAMAIFAGLVFIAGGIARLANKEGNNNSTVIATVVEISEEAEEKTTVKHAYVDYEVDGIKYEHVRAPEQYGGISTNDLSVGDTVEIPHQLVAAAENAKHSTTFVTLLVIGLGSVTVFLSSVTAYKMFKSMKAN